MKISLQILAAILGLIFLAAGGAKLSGQEAMIESFTHFGKPIWFMYFVGLSEVAGGIVLQIPKLAKYAASGLLLIMIGALGSHALVDPIQNAIPAIILGGLLIILIWGLGKLTQDEPESSAA